MLIENDLGVYVLSLIIVSIIFFNFRAKIYKDNMIKRLHNYFFLLCIILNLTFLVWLITRAYLSYSSLLILNLTTYIIFLLTPLTVLTWLVYLHYLVYKSYHKTKTLVKFMSIVALISSILSIINIFNGCSFVIDKVGYLNISYPPVIGLLSKLCLSGINFFIPVVTISMVLIYIFVQNEGLNTDYLTGLHSRRYADIRLEKMYYKNFAKNEYACIMIDVDSFKEINDSYGHLVGDEALKSVAKSLENSIMNPIILSRYGGDEFLALIKVKSNNELNNVVEKIYDELKKFNLASELPFNLTLTAGYVLIDKNRFKTICDLINHIDTHMYNNKRLNRFANMPKLV